MPTDALWSPPPIEEFCWRIEQQVGEGGFALVTGDPGTGKSAALRLLASRLASLRDLSIGILTRPQASLADVYREAEAMLVARLGDISLQALLLDIGEGAPFIAGGMPPPPHSHTPS